MLDEELDEEDEENEDVQNQDDDDSEDVNDYYMYNWLCKKVDLWREVIYEVFVEEVWL